MPYAGGAVAPLDPNDKAPTARVWSAQRLLTFFRDQNGSDPSIERSVLPGQRTLKVEVERSTKCRVGPVIAYHAVDGTHASTVNELPSGRLLAEFFRDRGR
ncbi:MAG TPA: hypothetical protein VK148_25560 [Xanthobacteraceae bacterium]|nr:hypothetical protein [Xanthobacteraceae bacterium]